MRQLLVRPVRPPMISQGYHDDVKTRGDLRTELSRRRRSSQAAKFSVERLSGKGSGITPHALLLKLPRPESEWIEVNAPSSP